MSCPWVTKKVVEMGGNSKINSFFRDQDLRPKSETRMYETSFGKFSALVNMALSEKKRAHLSHGIWTASDIPLPRTNDAVPLIDHGLVSILGRDTDDISDSV